MLDECKVEQQNNEKQLKRKLKEKDQLIANLVNEIDHLKMSSKDQHFTIDLVEKNQLLSSQQINLDQVIKNISIYQKNNVPEMLMINLDDTSATSRPNHSSLFNRTGNSIFYSINHDQSNHSLRRPTVCNEQLLKDDKSRSMNASANQSTNQPNTAAEPPIKQFCDQINTLQREFSLIVDEEEKRCFMLKIEDFVLKNMRKLVVEKMDSFFDTLQLYLANLKFDIIQFAIENEQKRQFNVNIRKSVSSIEWLKLMTSNLTNRKDNKTLFLDHNNNQQISVRNLRNNFQSRTIERRMIELRRSIETYLKSYLVRIVLEIQEQNC